MTTAYETDFYQWTQQQAALLREGLLSALDTANLAEEIESMGKKDRRSIGSHLRNIFLHLLKWCYQPERRGTSWIESIGNARDEVEDILADSPSLVPQVSMLIAAEYPRARRKAAHETGLPLATFAEQCPFTVEQITGDYWPD